MVAYATILPIPSGCTSVRCKIKPPRHYPRAALLNRRQHKWHGTPSLDKVNLLKTLQTYADEAARHFENVLEEATSQYHRIIGITHVPPFREAAWYQEKVSDDDFLPYFSCKAVGDVMKQVMRANPQSTLLVLCGHTHGGGELQVLDNLRVLTGETQYGHPKIQRILEIE